MEVLSGVLVVAFLISILRNTMHQLFLWQIKEYRLDRFLVHLKTWQGKRLLFGKIQVAKWLLLFSLPLFYQNQSFFFWLVLGIFFIEGVLAIRYFFTLGWKLPVFTLKTVAILIVVLSSLLGGLFVPFLNLAIRALILDRILFFLVGFFIVLANIPAKIFQRFVIFLAKRKIKSHPQLLVIGITGSYGKSSTKEFLAQILSQKFKVLKTPANINTDIGVAKTILAHLKKNHQIFVCEMGAYKKGEIKAICEIVNPKIGIITGICEQHLSLFGSFENIIKTKFELIESLPPKGLAVFNGNNKYCLKMAQEAKRIGKKIKVVKPPSKPPFKTDLPGKYFWENALLAQVVAKKLGMTQKEIDKIVKRLKAPPCTMQILKKDDLVLIDDTYNSNPWGVLAALEYLKTFKGKKILVFQPMIELGKASARLHQEVGKRAAQICDQIFLTNKNFYQDFLKGAQGKVKLGRDLPKIEKGAILFEGREAGVVLKLLISNG